MTRKMRSIRWCEKCQELSYKVVKCQRRTSEDCGVMLRCSCGTSQMVIFPNQLSCDECVIRSLKGLRG